MSYKLTDSFNSTLSYDRWLVSPETDPVHNEDLVDVESLLEQFGCDGYRVEIAEAPETAANTRRDGLKVALRIGKDLTVQYMSRLTAQSVL